MLSDESLVVISDALDELDEDHIMYLPCTVVDILTTIAYHLPPGKLQDEVNEEILLRVGKAPSAFSPEFKQVLNTISRMVF